MRVRVMWDLFSGFGGASQAFVQSENWSVYRFENNPELAHVPLTNLFDVLDWKNWFKAFPQPDFIWASPPCLQFSRAFNAPRSIAQRAGVDFSPDLRPALAAVDLIEELSPQNWALENVAGAVKDLSAIPALGDPMRYPPFFIWGNIPPLILPVKWHHYKADHDKRHSALRANYRAKIPFEISTAILDAIENQLTLRDFI